MKILVIGFLALFCWSALSTYIYVCKVKGLCNETETILISNVSVKNANTADSLPNTLAGKPVTIPKNLFIYFAFDKSEFNFDAVTDKYVNESNEYLDQNSQARLSITGHTDAIGSDEYNQTLGYRRAQSVQHFFENKGLPANKIIIESKGEKEPVDDNNTTSGRANNRRTAITIKH
ncbi:MAG: OmpA family protein [Bacteroidetes bacterium]|nr:OmpA family protein [Bacteroidota bacterium]